MIITKEQQEAWITNYAKQNHTKDEIIGFVDGIIKVMDVIGEENKKNINKLLTRDKD